MPGDRRQILSLLRLPIPPLQRNREYQFSTRHHFAQLCCFSVAVQDLSSWCILLHKEGFR